VVRSQVKHQSSHRVIACRALAQRTSHQKQLTRSPVAERLESDEYISWLSRSRDCALQTRPQLSTWSLLQLAQHGIVLGVSPRRWSLRWWPSSLAREPNLAYDAGNRPVSVFTS
jgi:hypothetical protein